MKRYKISYGNFWGFWVFHKKSETLYGANIFAKNLSFEWKITDLATNTIIDTSLNHKN